MTRRKGKVKPGSSLSPDDTQISAEASKSYAKAGFEYRVITRHYGGPWVCERWPMCIAPIFGTKAFRVEHWRLNVMARFANKLAD
jgi:hypothetical protein